MNGTPSDADYQASADEMRADREDLAKLVTRDSGIQMTASSFLDHVEEVAIAVGGEAIKIGVPILEQLAIAAIQNAIEKRK